MVDKPESVMKIPRRDLSLFCDYDGNDRLYRTDFVMSRKASHGNDCGAPGELDLDYNWC